MYGVARLPAGGEVFIDARGTARALRVSWHSDDGVVVLSLWRGDTCAGTFRLGIGEVPALIATLRAGLDSAYADTSTAASDAGPATVRLRHAGPGRGVAG